jgi:hypothetical protein
MVSKTHGIASATRIVTGALQCYTVWCKSPSAFTDSENASGINLKITGNIEDDTQKNFELMVQSIGLRTMPIIINEPTAVIDLAKDGATSLTGEGFVWRFGVEQVGTFATSESEIGLLVKEMDGIVLPNGVILRTSGTDQNIEFEKEV